MTHSVPLSVTMSPPVWRACVCVRLCERGGGYYSLQNEGHKCELFYSVEVCVCVCAFNSSAFLQIGYAKVLNEDVYIEADVM